MSGEVRTRGDWPGVIQMRRGWAAARARPWNDQTPDTASLRLDRGSDRFVVACCEWLTRKGVQRVLTPALAAGQLGLWLRAGFTDHLDLAVFERPLTGPAEEPTKTVKVLDDPDLSLLAAIDDRAFNSTWRVGKGGLADALAATPVSVVMGVEESGTIVGFVIVGEAAGLAYLQRLAVDPCVAGGGIGRSLVRASIRWARARGARTMLLNTQPENRAAAGLYISEGFVSLPERLRVLGRTGEVTQ
ncbi:MAG: GNAT family N-acetyltransferase [Acidimicrobiia bacterium]